MADGGEILPVTLLFKSKLLPPIKIHQTNKLIKEEIFFFRNHCMKTSANLKCVFFQRFQFLDPQILEQFVIKIYSPTISFC